MRYVLLYDVHGVEAPYGYAKTPEELKQLCKNAIDDGVYQFRTMVFKNSKA